MGKPRMVSCYGYLNRPYDAVRALLRREPLDLLQRATTSAGARAKNMAATLRVELVGVRIGVDVRVRIVQVVEEAAEGALPRLRVGLAWESLRTPGLFPSMVADLVVWPPSPGGTQIEIQGGYWKPFGPVGTAFDATLGHRIAEASVHGFLNDLIEQLLLELQLQLQLPPAAR